jgi:poly-gamma-glutamate synthesis protein (capsule biosynthesis protein)
MEAQDATPKCAETAGRVERETYRSALLNTTMYYSVYFPPCYNITQSSYPVAYLMHGSNDDDGQWIRLGLAKVLDDQIMVGVFPPMVVIMPFGNQIANVNQFDARSWEPVFLDELLPAVESRYRVETRREGRAIGGISRGGFWAFSIAFRHPELFSVVGGHSAFFDPNNAPPENNPLDLALNTKGLDSLHIWLDRGIDDYAGPNLDLMHERLNARGIAHAYTIYPQGRHENAYWAQHVAEYLRFYAAALQGETSSSVAPQATATPANEAGLSLFLPVVAFPSIQANISAERLQAIRSGTADKNLVLDESTAAALKGFRISLSEETRIVRDDALLNTLWRDRTSFTLLGFDRLIPRYRVLHVDEAFPLDNDLSQYPFAFSSDQPNYVPSKLTRLLLSGVTALTRGTRDALDQHGVQWASEAILPYVSHADFFHTSNEVSLYPTCPQTNGDLLGGIWSMCSKPEHFDLLKDVGVKIVELTGNHNNDYGFDAYRATLQYYRDNGFQTVGGGDTLEEARQPLMLDHHGNRIAMIACNWAGPSYALATDKQPGAAYCDWNWLRTTLPPLAASIDLLVVTVQYPEFEQYTPKSKQQADFRALADLGADVVIGTSNHKPQTFEFYDAGRDSEAFIHYGMGNLFFDQDFWGNRRFFMDQLFIYEGRLLTVDLFTGIIDDLARPRPMTGDERTNFLQFMFVQQNGF